MSTSTPAGTPATPPSNAVVLPAGVQLGPGRETSQTNPQGQVVQGIVYPLTLSSGTVTSVFVPYTLVGNVPQIQALFDQRINGLAAISG
jgi:hypothetical protein